METGEWLTRTTVWVALALYVASESVNTVWRARRSAALAWWLGAVGCLFFLAHVACAFHYFHDWSHVMAYESTAQQTEMLETLDGVKLPEIEPGARFFAQIKRLTVDGYYTSRIGIDELNKGGRVPSTFACEHPDHA